MIFIGFDITKQIYTRCWSLLKFLNVVDYILSKYCLCCKVKVILYIYIFNVN